MSTPSIKLVQKLDCALPPRDLWALLADTGRLHRALGQVPLVCEELEGDGAARFRLRPPPGARGRTPVIEQPPTYAHPGELVLRRHFPSGVLAHLTTRFTLTPLLSGTRLEVTLELGPRAFAPLLELYGKWTLRSLVRKLAEIVAARGRGEDLLRRVVPLTPVQEKTLSRRQALLREHLPAEQHGALDKLLGHLRGLDDGDAAARALRPYVLADLWGEEREAVLGVFLGAARMGLLTFSWDVICPSCRLPAWRCPRLSDLHAEARCHRCELRIPVELARSAEVSFRPDPAIRPAPGTVYSSESPARTPHVLGQVILPGAGSVTLTVPAEPGEFRIFVRGGLEARLSVSTLGPPSAELEVGDAITPARIELAMGGTLTVRHPGAAARHLKIERPEWPERDEQPTANAHAVTLHPAFRRWFSTLSPQGTSDTGEAARPELLRPGLSLRVPQVGLVLTELVNATELCQRRGDAGALKLVREQLELVQQVAEGAGGTLVRTERDGALLAFPTPQQAARGAFLVQRAVAALAAAGEHEAGGELALRIGVFGGPCEVTTQSGLLDYYGQTVLVTTRLLREAHAGDILLPAELAESLALSAASESLGTVKLGPRFALSIRGLEKPVGVVRVNYVPPEETPPPAA